MSKQRQIIGFGGGTLAPYENRALERYVLDAAGVARPKICFIGTASGDDHRYRARFFETFGAFDCERVHLPLFYPAPQRLREFILSCDVIFVGGGNTKSMLALWREWELDAILREAWEAGVVLSGESAGMLCWFRQCLTGPIVDTLVPLNGLGFLPYSASPHFEKEVARRPEFHRLIRDKVFGAGYGVDDGTGLHFIDEQLAKVITVSNGAGAYRVSSADGDVREEKLDSVVLKPLIMHRYNVQQKIISLKYRLRGWDRGE